ncbi:prepilin-type N-terminal cleavage/methylation domain-containing protein [Pseudomonas sp. PLMAX]|uniref:type IV pilus modification PilV family protein n=1 Tax=Pseudomonas sp. PLMAX TaxID=2201998 RepID=UPI0038BD02F7
MRNGFVLKSKVSIQTGFSLIEIVMVIAILSVILLSAMTYQGNAKQALAEHKNDRGGAMSAENEPAHKLPSSTSPIAPLSRNISNQDIF